MSVRVLIVCDSDPAPYAGGASWPCRAYLPTRTELPLAAQGEAVVAGWAVELTTDPVTHVNTYRHTCPACRRARAAQRPQEAPA